MYCSMCGNKTDDRQYICIGILHSNLVLCSVECTEHFLDAMSRALGEKMLPLKNEDIED